MTTPSQISPHLFLDETLSETDLAGSRLCLAAMATLRHLAANDGIALTKSGAFNRKFIVWAVDQFQWPHYTAEELYVVNKVLNEDDVLPLSYLHGLLLAAKLIRHRKGKANLTKEGKAIIGDHGRLQVTLFETFFTKFDFAAREPWPNEMPDADTIYFLGVIRKRLSDWVPYPEFTRQCFPIFALPAQRGMAEEDAMFYLATHVVRPLNWLGLLEQKEVSRWALIDTKQLRKTPLFDKFLRFEISQNGSDTLH